LGVSGGDRLVFADVGDRLFDLKALNIPDPVVVGSH
jgi:hypothetical protein